MSKYKLKKVDPEVYSFQSRIKNDIKVKNPYGDLNLDQIISRGTKFTDLVQLETGGEIDKITPVIDEPITSTQVDYNDTLSESILSGTFKDNVTNDTVNGILDWVDPSQHVTESKQYDWIFTPFNSNDYANVEGSVLVESTALPSVSSPNVNIEFNSNTEVDFEITPGEPTNAGDLVYNKLQVATDIIFDNIFKDVNTADDPSEFTEVGSLLIVNMQNLNLATTYHVKVITKYANAENDIISQFNTVTPSVSKPGIKNVIEDDGEHEINFDHGIGTNAGDFVKSIIERSTDGFQTVISNEITDNGVGSFRYSDFESGTEYQFRIKTEFDLATSDYSDTYKFTTPVGQWENPIKFINWTSTTLPPTENINDVFGTDETVIEYIFPGESGTLLDVDPILYRHRILMPPHLTLTKIEFFNTLDSTFEPFNAYEFEEDKTIESIIYKSYIFTGSQQGNPIKLKLYFTYE